MSSCPRSPETDKNDSYVSFFCLFTSCLSKSLGSMTGMPFKRTAGIYKPNSNMPNLPLPQCMLCVRFVFLRRELSLSAQGRAHMQREGEGERGRKTTLCRRINQHGVVGASGSPTGQLWTSVRVPMTEFASLEASSYAKAATCCTPQPLSQYHCSCKYHLSRG